ncbi:potassium-transporting ATPase subunit KdpA [Planosporangium sp. 12N6]|uniref:potassium-transporting ATPase subunit KdpA n=1 Tax=Planosporangium spinosum TaxID=3402278 RepID=UPI003CFB8E74
MAGWLQAVVVVAVVGALHVPLGDHMARVYTAGRHWRVEAAIYRLCGIDPAADQRWQYYLGSLLAVSGVGVLLLYALLRLQSYLPMSQGHGSVPAPLAFNTAVSFTTNTSWQNYAGEATLGHLAQEAGLGTQAFVSAAVGLAAGLALIRGLTRSLHDGVGNFWVDLTRSIVRILLPLSVVSGVLLIACGVLQSPGTSRTVTTLAGHRQTIPDGLVGSWEPIKLLSGDGGGLFNAGSAHPYENPTAFTNAIEIILMLLVPTAFIRTYGRLVGDRRQGWALLTVVGLLFAASLAATSVAEHAHHDTALTAAGAAAEGTETRFGPPASALFGTAATASADGAANASYDSFASLGGGTLLATIMLGEVAPGGAGSGLYGLVIVSLLAVFIAGLMVGRTPEYLGKRLEAREMKLITLYLLGTPAVILIGTAVAVALPAGRAAIGNPGPHGLSEIAYAFTSSATSNGSTFAGLTADTTFYNTALAVTMLVGRYLPIVFVVALAGSLARQQARPVTVGTLPTHGPLFVTLVTTFVLIFTALDFVLILALGPLAEGLRR